MNYISLDNLTRYHSKFKDYADAKYSLARDYGWKQTEKAGAVTCWPVGESRLKPVVEFLFKETLPVSDKSSQNPSTITGVSNINLWLAGKNISRVMPYYGFTDGVMVVNGVTFTANADGSVTINGLANGNANCPLHNSNNTSAYGEPIGVGVWVVSGCPSGSNYTYSLQTMISTGYGSSSGYEFGSGSTATITKPGAKIGLAIRIPSGYNAQNLVFKPQIELGCEKTTYEQPVEKQNRIINLGSVFYGGVLDVSTGKLTVTHRMIEADSLTLDISNYPAYLPLECTDTFGRTITSTGNILALTGSTGGKIVYKLANPYTVQIDPVAITALPQIDKYTPRLNTLYTDAENITVKYVKSPIRDEYEKVQAIIANGGTV